MGFIRKRFGNKNPEKMRIDTCFFSKEIAVNNDAFRQSKMKIEKFTDNILKYYLISDPDYSCIFEFTVNPIPLEGYFEMVDESKPYDDPIYEPFLYDTPYHYYPPLTCGVYVTPKYDTRQVNAGGWFSKGLKHGKWEVFDGHSFAKIEEHYTKGIRDGLYTVYDKDNTILYQTKFINGTGKEKIYRNDGSIYRIKHFKQGFTDTSKPITFFYENGQIAILSDDYTTKHFYQNGSLFSTQQNTQKDDKNYAHGVYKGYNRQGQLKEQCYYEYNTLIRSIRYDHKKRIETIEAGNMLQYYKRGKLKKMVLFDYNAIREDRIINL